MYTKNHLKRLLIAWGATDVRLPRAEYDRTVLTFPVSRAFEYATITWDRAQSPVDERLYRVAFSHTPPE